ncbi:MAG TPA: cytochrome b, partial [Gammaproteobacteria bacterium]|nr:cytochrome b [Gammaproteobacteria bacterium]
GVLGTLPAGDIETLIARVCAVIYFAFFVLMPFYTSIDKTLPVPDRVTMK